MKESQAHKHSDLIERCRDNDKKAQMEIYKLYYKAMYNTSLRILNDPAEAEDIMQDSFLAAFSRIGTYSGESEFGAWLKRIVINNSIDALKKRKETLPIGEEQMEAADASDEEEWENRDYMVQEIRNAVSSLRKDDRAIISLHLFEGYDHQEISDIMEISYNATRTRYARARSRLLGLLASERMKGTFINPN